MGRDGAGRRYDVVDRKGHRRGRGGQQVTEAPLAASIPEVRAHPPRTVMDHADHLPVVGGVDGRARPSLDARPRRSGARLAERDHRRRASGLIGRHLHCGSLSS